MTANEKDQWNSIEKAKQLILKWSKKNRIYIHTMHFIPYADYSLEVYVFYEKDEDIATNQNNGVTENIKKNFLEALRGSGCNQFKNNISFVFDSHENVIKNYEGSYFFRLR